MNILLSHSRIICLLLLILFSINTSPDTFAANDNDGETTTFHLNLRIHLMTDITMTHSSGISMDSWVTPSDIRDIIIPEVNNIWKQADIKWLIESIITEDVVKHNTYEESIAFVASTKRDSKGRSDRKRLPHLNSLMQAKYMSKADELGKNLFHIYLFPFIGNTSQGNAMRHFNWHTIVGTWSNKHNRGGVPVKSLLIEDHDAYKRGSLSRTIAHEIGHVLSLRHKQCKTNCLMGGRNQGYLLTQEQIERARTAARKRQ